MTDTQEVEQAEEVKGELVRPDDEQAAFREMDRLDEEQILDALQGKPSKIMVYKFAVKGKQQTGLTYEGISECVRELNANRHARIRVSPEYPPVVEEVVDTDENDQAVTFIDVMVYAEDELNGGGEWGHARQRKFQTFRDANKKPELDTFAKTKALSKAQRNAMKPLIPLAFRETVIAQALGDAERVKMVRVGEGAGQAALLAPPVEGEEADAKRAEAEDLFRQIQEKHGRLKLYPAKFYEYKRVAEQSLERLDEFLGFLRNLLAEEAPDG